jgi:hypothetical protein
MKDKMARREDRSRLQYVSPELGAVHNSISVNRLLTLQDSWVDRSLILGRIQLCVNEPALNYRA